MIRKLALFVLVVMFAPLAAYGGEKKHHKEGDVPVDGYTKKDGTYVEPYYRTPPNDTKEDNYSTKGNTNPYTGEKGTKDPDDSKDK